MARRLAELPEGARISDYIRLGAIAKTFPPEQTEAVLAATGKASARQRELPAHVVVYYVIALVLYMQSSCREVLRCLLEGLQWLSEPGTKMKVAGNSAISQARPRLGAPAPRQLHDELVQPIAAAATRGAWYRRRRLVSLDGGTTNRRRQRRAARSGKQRGRVARRAAAARAAAGNDPGGEGAAGSRAGGRGQAKRVSARRRQAGFGEKAARRALEIQAGVWRAEAASATQFQRSREPHHEVETEFRAVLQRAGGGGRRQSVDRGATGGAECGGQ